jgi:hypothetical protein
MVNISEAERSTIWFESLGVRVEGLVRHPDTGTAEFVVLLSSRNIDSQPTDDGKSSADMLLAIASLSGSSDFLASRLESFMAIANNQDATRVAKTLGYFPVKIRIPRRTQSVRVVIEAAGNGRTGAVELNRKTIDNAPEAPTPEPKLIPQPLKEPTPPASSQRWRCMSRSKYYAVCLPRTGTLSAYPTERRASDC